MIMFIKVIRAICLKVVPASSAGSVLGVMAWRCRRHTGWMASVAYISFTIHSITVCAV